MEMDGVDDGSNQLDSTVNNIGNHFDNFLGRQQGSGNNNNSLVSNVVDRNNNNNSKNLNALNLLVEGHPKTLSSPSLRNVKVVICKSGFASDIGTRSRMEDEICLFDDFNSYFKKDTKEKMAQYLRQETYVSNDSKNKRYVQLLVPIILCRI